MTRVRLALAAALLVVGSVSAQEEPVQGSDGLVPLFRLPDGGAVVFYYRVSADDEKRFELFDAAKKQIAVELAKARSSQDPYFVPITLADGRQVPADPAVEGEPFVLEFVEGRTEHPFYQLGIQLADRRKDGLVKVIDMDGWTFPPDPTHALVLSESDSRPSTPSDPPPSTPSVAPDREQISGFGKLLRDFSTGSGTNSLNRRESGLPAVIGDVLEDPATLNSVLAAAIGDSGSPLANLNLEFKTFANGADTSLGVGFDFDRSWNVFEDGKSSVYGLDYSLTLRGDVAFEQELNPQDLVEGRFSLDFFHSSGGVQFDAKNDPDPTGKKFNDLATKLATYETDAAFLGAKEWSEISALAQDRFSTQVYWEVGIDAGMEANQSFTQRNSFVGAHVALDIKAWRRHSLASWLNFFDHPFALVRTITGYDREFTPRGSTIPTVIIGFDHLEPEGNSPRQMVGDRNAFQRLRAEVAFKTPIARSDDAEFFAVLNWRYYREINASAAIKSAQLDEFDFFSAAIESENGLFLSYAVGQLPFGVTDNEFVELGWKLNF